MWVQAGDVCSGAALCEKGRFDGSFKAWLALGWSVLVLSLAAISLLMLLIRRRGRGAGHRLSTWFPALRRCSTYVLFGETRDGGAGARHGRVRGGGVHCERGGR